MMDPVAEVRQKTAVVLSSLRELEPNGLGWRKRASLKRYRLQPYPDTVAITYTMFRDSHHGGRQDSGGFPPHRVTSQSFAGSPHNVPNHESIGPGPHYHAPPSHMTVTQGEESSARRKRLRMDSLTSSPSTHQGGLCDDESKLASLRFSWQSWHVCKNQQTRLALTIWVWTKPTRQDCPTEATQTPANNN